MLCAIFCTINLFGKVKISNAGKEFIKEHEKCVLTAYWDSDGYSIGYGHHSIDIKKNQKITKAQADRYFDEDIKIAEKSVERLLSNLPYKYDFSQGFIDGFVSFVYNCGEGGAKKSTFYQRLLKCRVKNGKINESDYNFTVSGIKQSRISCNSHIQRRLGEHKLMIN